MASFRIRIKPSAAKEIEAIDARPMRQRIVSRIQALGADPRPHGYEKLSGKNDLFRIRVNRYRVVYSIHDSELIVHVIQVGHRRDVNR